MSKNAVFVMPVFLDGGEQSVRWLNQAVESVLAQTDPNWRLIMVNDHSPLPGAAAVLKRLQAKDSRIHIVTTKANSGAGAARNSGVQWARQNGHPFIVYLDADDVAHPKRAETVRRTMLSDPAVGVVYSTFAVVDENNQEVAWDKLSGSIQEILECHRSNPPQGDKAWIDIGTVTGYATLTSAMAVTTELAVKQPFPEVRAVEDAHAWFRYGAEGKKFVYDPAIPAQYRIPQHAADSAMRDRMGGVDAYYAAQCDVERDGFAKAIEIALANGGIKQEQSDHLMAGYHVRMGQSMRHINQFALADREIERAYEVSPHSTGEWVRQHGYDWALPLIDNGNAGVRYQQAFEE